MKGPRLGPSLSEGGGEEESVKKQANITLEFKKKKKRQWARQGLWAPPPLQKTKQEDEREEKQVK